MISSIGGVVSVTADMEREPGTFDYEIEAEEGRDIRRELFKRIAARNWTILMLKTTELTLEDIFLKITMGSDITIGGSKKKAAAVSEDDAKAMHEAVDQAVIAAQAIEMSKKLAAGTEAEEEYDGGEM